ncbi:MAG: lipoyl(octanoyl) transferase LipB [Kiritimatiellae bacterium]|nr:lipoyl(octanoyl) transferase LipB [Kiritimatiellia bacterium]MDW8459168.1 lipoyl(octanoyl) transferase LipB [Verrucomicrobiota bacterium]
MAGEAIGLYFERPLRFTAAARLQEALVDARHRGEIPDTILFLEHTPVVTLGRRGRTRFLLRPAEHLRAIGIDVECASRGGDVTYHAPGQLVIYPILRLAPRTGASHTFLWNLEELAIRTAASYGISAYRREGKNGAWTDAGKLAAIGFHLKRWVVMHGMSFNVNLDLTGFSYIVGCGLVGEKVTSLAELLGPRCPRVSDVRDQMARHFSDIFETRLSCFQAFEAPDPVVSGLLRSALNCSTGLQTANGAAAGPE